MRILTLLAFVLPVVLTGARLPKLSLELVATGLEQPVFVTGVPDDPGTLLVVEQAGRIRRIVRGSLIKGALLDIRDRVSSGGERGLLSFAFAPRWPEDRTIFVNYTDRGGDTVVERYRVRRSGRRVSKKSAVEVISIEQPFSNHNGGQLAFGPNGYLYIGMGDGGAGGDPRNAGQDLTTLLSKMLRIDVAQLPFSIPADNPVLPDVGQTPIWALGLRNPWRFSFDQATGDLYIADVGQNAVEEIDFELAGHPGGTNYGWRVREGSQVFSSNTEPATTPLVDPVHEYTHDDGQSVTGGYVYRGTAFPQLDGHYFYADFITRRIWSFKVRKGRTRNRTEWTSSLTDASGETPAVSSFGQDTNGEIYLCDYFNGSIYRIVSAS